MRGVTLFALVLALGWAGTVLGAEQPTRESSVEKAKTAPEELLECKLAELAVLQDKIRDLRRVTGRRTEIVLHVQLVELSRTKMRDLGVDFENAFRTTQTTKGADSKGVAEAVSLLAREQALQVLSESTLLLSDGRPACFFNGREFPVPVMRADGSKTVQGRKFGTQIDVVAVHAGGDRIHLEFRAVVSELDPALSGTIGEVVVPGLRSREIDTALEMKLGQTVILGRGGPEGKVVTVVDADGDLPIEQLHEVETLFIVTPEATGEKQ